MIKESYAAAKVPMLPVVRGERATRRAILAWTVLTVALSLLPLAAPVWRGTAAAPLSVAYGTAAVLLGGAFLGGAWQVLRHGGQAVVRRFYFFTILYLGALLLCMALTRN